jgi:hypothetical protein
MRRRMLLAAVLSVVAVLGITSTAFGHECFIANRSANGDAGAQHSANWVFISVEGFVNSPDFPPGVDGDCFLEYWASHGGPAGFTVRSDMTIGEGSSNPNLGDGSGLDHIEVAFGPLLGAALGACAL